MSELGTHRSTEGGARPSASMVPALIVAVVAISLAASFFKKASPTHPLVSAGVRLAVAAVILAPLVARAAWRRRLTGRLVRHGLAAGLCYSVHFGAWVWSLELTSVAASVTLVTATPILLGVWALLTGRDRPSRRHWISIGIALVGLWIIGTAADGRAGPLMGDALALLGAAGMAAYLLVARRLGTFDVWVFSGVAVTVAAVVLLATATALGIPPWPASAAAFGWLALAALIPQLVGHTLMTWAVRHAPPIVVGIATVGEPIGATLISWVWLGEVVGPQVALGCAITLAAVLVSLGPQRAAPSGQG